jgi:hypothetical protein
MSGHTGGKASVGDSPRRDMKHDDASSESLKHWEELKTLRTAGKCGSNVGGLPEKGSETHDLKASRVLN